MTWRRILVAAFAAYVAACLFGGAYFVDRSIHRTRRHVTESDRIQAANLTAMARTDMANASIQAADDQVLRGWTFAPHAPNGDAVLLLHGINANRTAMVDMVPLLLDHGYRVLAVDLRGHGESGGDLVTFGALDRDDIARWIAYLHEPASDACVYAFGGSLGAGLAVQAANTPGLCGVVADSVFDSLRETAFDRIGQQAHTGPWLGRTLLRPGIELGFLHARARYGVSLGEPSAVAVVTRPGAPVLLIHGTEDTTSAPRQAALIEAANPTRVSLWLVPGAGHGGARHAAPAEYDFRVVDFFATHRTPNR